jgi:hypothetical protein
VEDAYEFYPPQEIGFLFNLVLVLLLGSASVWSIFQASRTQVGASFLLFLLMGLFALALTPVFAYRVRALVSASYGLQRDGIRLKWGLRVEDIPMDKVLWVNHAHDMEPVVPLPRVYWPGSVLGTRRTKDGIVVEFFAARSTDLILVATHERVFAISPEDPEAFLTTFTTLAQLGSLAPIPAQSLYSSFLLAGVWKDRVARVMLLSSVTLSLALLAWVSLIIPEHTQIILDLSPETQSSDFVPSIQLLLLPALNWVFLGADLLLGLFFYRRGDHQTSTGEGQPGPSKGKTLAYLLWGSGVLTSLLFIGAVFFITKALSV